MIQNPYEKAIVDAAIEFHGDWKGYIKSPGSVEDLLQAVNDYLASQKPAEIDRVWGAVNKYCNSQAKVAEIEPLNWQGKCFAVSPATQNIFSNMVDVARKVDELVAAVNKQNGK